jgi:hypothetical protein
MRTQTISIDIKNKPKAAHTSSLNNKTKKIKKVFLNTKRKFLNPTLVLHFPARRPLIFNTIFWIVFCKIGNLIEL